MKAIVEAMKTYVQKTDRWLWFLSILTFSFGVLVLYSMKVSFNLTWRQSGLITHVGAAGVGVLAAFILSNIDYMDMCRFWKVHAPAALLLAASLFFLPKTMVVEVMGNRNWLVIPGLNVTIQPSEFLKISFILTFAYHIGKVQDVINRPIHLFLLLIHAAVPTFLIFRLGDDGTMLLFIFIAGAMLVGGGISFWYVLGAGGALAIAAPLAWQMDLLKDYQKNRILAILTPGTDPSGIEFQQDQGLISMGSGGMFGNGLFPERPMKFYAIENDFIFTYIGQILGFIGCMAVVLLLAAVAVKVLYNGTRSVTTEGRVICAGVFGMIAGQTIVNLGMALKVLPVIGITLPFFSQGGSSILSIFMAIGLVISVYMHNAAPLFKLRR